MKALLVTPAAVLVTLAVAIAPASDETVTGPRESLQQMLDDRPGLAELLRKDPAILDWMAGEFAGNGTGLRILWDPAEPLSGRAAEHEYPSEQGSVIVRVSARMSALDQLTGVTYELHNARRHERFDAIHEQAVQGKIDRDEYVRSVLEQEFAALRETRRFLQHQLPRPNRHELRQSPLLDHVLQSESSLEGHLDKYRRQGTDLREYFEALYDREVSPLGAATGR